MWNYKMQFTSIFPHPLKTSVTGAWFGWFELCVLKHLKQPLPQQHFFLPSKNIKKASWGSHWGFQNIWDSPGAVALPWDPTNPEPELACSAVKVLWFLCAKHQAGLCVLSSISGSSAKPWVSRTHWVLLCVHCISIYTKVLCGKDGNPPDENNFSCTSCSGLVFCTLITF